FFFFQAEDGIRDFHVTGVQTCALPILGSYPSLHNILQRKLPECDLSLQKVGRSIVQVRGDCQDPERFNGKMEGLVEFVSTHEIRSEERRVGKECRSRLSLYH